jgi:hypothetical protein
MGLIAVVSTTSMTAAASVRHGAAEDDAVETPPAEVVHQQVAAPLTDVLGLVGSGSPEAVSVLGLELSVDDAAAVADRMARQNEVREVAATSEPALGASYGGVWFDPATGMGHIGVTGTPSEAAGEVAAAGVKLDRVVFDPVEHSVADLEQAWGAVSALVEGASGYSVVGSGLDEKRNRVVVEVSGDTDEAARDLAPIRDTVVVTPGRAAVPMTSRTDPFVFGFKNYQAGMRLYSPSNGSCSGAFTVRKSGVPVILTAGHCAQASDWTIGSPNNNPPNDYPIGSSGAADSAWSPPQPGQDVRIIRVDQPGWTLPNCIYIQTDRCDPITHFGDPVQGSVVCQSQAVTDAVTCGIVESANWTQVLPSGGGTIANGAKSRIFTEHAANCANFGDSGAPVFEWGVPAFGTPVVANGVFSATNGDCNNQVRYFSRWSRIKAALGLDEPSGVANATPALATASTYDANRIWLFHVANNQLAYTRFDTASGSSGLAWESWKVLPGPQGGWKGNPSATRNQDGRVEVFAVGNDGNLHSVYEWQNAPSWALSSYGRPSLPAGVSLTGSVAASINGVGKLEVFVTSTDGIVWHRWQNVVGGNWSSWHAFTTQQGALRLYGGLATALDPAGKLTLVGIGAQSGYFGGQAHRLSQTCSGCGWQSSFTALPSAGLPLLWTGAGMIQHDDGHLEYFGAGVDGVLRHAYQSGSNWAWGSLGHSTYGGVSAAPGRPLTDGSRNEYVFGATGPVGGSDPQLPSTQSYYTRFVQSSGWGPWCATGNDLATPCP